MSFQKRQSVRNDDGGVYEESVSPVHNIPQVYHQAKFPSQKGDKQPQNMYDEINEKAHLHNQPHVVGFNT